MATFFLIAIAAVNPFQNETPLPSPLRPGLAAQFMVPTLPPGPPPAPYVPPPIFSLNSTSYCTSGIMASGVWTYVGAVANNMWPLGTRLKILSGEYAGSVVTVSDRIGWGSQLDFYTPNCGAAWNYGREQISVEVMN